MNNKSRQKKISSSNLKLQDSVVRFLRQLGEDPDRDGLKETPERCETAYKYLLSGYDRSLEEENKLFDNLKNYKDIITLKNIDFFSLCEHHLLPFFGYAHIGYIPGKKVLGISKLSRAVDIYSRRLQDQETLSSQIGEALLTLGKAKGVAVLMEGQHFCNIARGVEKKMSVMTTLTYHGVFKENKNYQKRFDRLVADRMKP